ncbi:MAG: alpha/beta hydrolase, partial [Fimbriimonadaceae bacterium]|nr:alpha/beta hydrolase [Alphaproteobacteria bacterium]
MELVGIAENPVPDGAIVDSITAFDGIQLRYARWQTTAPRSKGTVCLFSGRGEFIEKYFEVVTELREKGFAVAIMDWRGQGGSDRVLSNPRKGYVDDFENYELDMRRFMEEIVLPDCPAPYFALAHSMGGNILLRAARLGDCWFDRMVLV